MQNKPVESSVILSIGYDDERRILKVRFRNGRVYYYLGVPESAYQSLITSSSIGKYFNEVIKPSYRVVRVRNAAAED